MIRQFIVVTLILSAVLFRAQADGPDDRYVQIYNLIQEADNLNDAGQAREAALKYFEAEKALKTLQSEYPDWNANVVKFRLSYIASKLEPLAGKYAAPAAPAATNAPPAMSVPGPAIANGQAETNQMRDQLKELQEEVKRLTAQNGLLEAKLKEALSVQPAALDPREMAKAEEQIKTLQKQRDLLQVSLEQERSKAPKAADPAILDQERQIVIDVKQKLAEQTQLAMALQKENNSLKRLLTDPSVSLDKSPASEELNQQLQAARASMAALQSSNLTLRTEQILLESRVNDLLRQLSSRRADKHTKTRPDEHNQQLNAALARLAVYEAKPVPYTPEELALFKQPDLKVNIGETSSSPVKRTVKELPPGAGPIMEQARRAMEAGRFDEAEKKFVEVLRQDDKNVYVMGNLAIVQIEQDRLADAEKTISQALTVDPRDPGCLFTMGVLKFRQEKYDAALDSLSLATSLVPDEPRAQYYLGKTLIQKGNRVAAEAALRKAVQLRPGWGEAHFSLAMVYATQHPPFKELAQWHYKQAIVAGYPRDLEFEKLLEDKKTVAAGP